MKKMNSSRPTQGSFAAAVGEFDIDPDIYNEVGDVYGDKLPLEGPDLVKNSNKNLATTGPENATDVSMPADESSCILRNLSFFEVFDGETGEYVQLEDITQLRKSKGKQKLCPWLWSSFTKHFPSLNRDKS